MIAICGMGGSSLAAEYIKVLVKKPIIVVRDYEIPDFVEEVILVSYSGNTEETISCFYDALKKNKKILAVITSNGKLEEIAKEKGINVIKLPKGYQPRFAFWEMFFALLDIFDKELKDKAQKIYEKYKDKVDGKEIAEKIRNPVIIYTYEKYFCLAYRFKAMLNENAKHFAFVSLLPEANHNEIECFYKKENFDFVFIKANYPERIKLRYNFTKKLLEKKGFNVIEVDITKEDFLEELIYGTLLLDDVSLKLAFKKGVDPYKIENIEKLKEYLKKC